MSGDSILILVSLLALGASLWAAVFASGFILHLKSMALYRLLKRDYRFSVRESLLPSRSCARGVVDGHAIFIVSESAGGKRCLQVRLESERFLPPPLEMIKVEIKGSGELGCTGYDNRRDSFRFGSEDFAGINHSAGRTVLGDDLREDLILLEMRAVSWAASDNLMVVNLPSGKTPVKTGLDTILIAARVASRFRATTARTDLFLHLLNFRARQLIPPPERMKYLGLLMKRYRTHPVTRETFRFLARSSDFELACAAAEALDVPALDHLCGVAKSGAPENRLRAIRRLCEPDVAGGVAFLVGHFPHAADSRCRALIVSTVLRADVAKGVALALAGLTDASSEVRTAAIAALAERGGPKSLPPLAAFAADPREPERLRRDAAEAAVRIGERYGISNAGLLSLAGGEAAEGGLSRAEGGKGEGESGEAAASHGEEPS